MGYNSAFKGLTIKFEMSKILSRSDRSYSVRAKEKCIYIKFNPDKNPVFAYVQLILTAYVL